MSHADRDGVVCDVLFPHAMGWSCWCQRRLESKVAQVEEALSGVGDVLTVQDRARYAYIRGRCLDVFSDFDKEAENCLSRAVKLRPSDTNAWNALGHCLWKKPDLFGAKRCFVQALNKERRVESLRHLSMLLRQLPGSTEEQAGYLEESLRLAKEAVTRDMTSGESWYVLGNAYVASFFRNSRGMKDLDRALQAYAKAEANDGGKNPDLFFNRAQVLLYREDYSEAARDYSARAQVSEQQPPASFVPQRKDASFGTCNSSTSRVRQAQRLDPSLPVSQSLHDIEAGVERLAELVEKKGGLKHKRMSQLVSGLKGVSLDTGGKGSPQRVVCLKDLKLGVNAGAAIPLKAVMLTGHGASPPERLLVVDAEGACAVLSLYSITKEACDKIHSRDVLVVRSPTLKHISWACRSREWADEGASGSESREEGSREDAEKKRFASFQGIQADPAEILINGKSMRACFAPPSVRLSNFDK